MKNIQTIRNHANKQLTAVGQGGEGNPIYNVYGDYEITHNKKHVESNRPPWSNYISSPHFLLNYKIINILNAPDARKA